MAGGLCLRVVAIDVVSTTVLLIQGDCERPEIAEVVGMSTDHIESDLSLEASKKGSSHVLVTYWSGSNLALSRSLSKSSMYWQTVPVCFSPEKNRCWALSLVFLSPHFSLKCS